MQIKMTSPLTGRLAVMEIDVTPEQLNAWRHQDVSIQDAMPNLSPDEREFIMTGYTVEDWNRMFPKGDDE